MYGSNTLYLKSRPRNSEAGRPIKVVRFPIYVLGAEPIESGIRDDYVRGTDIAHTRQYPLQHTQCTTNLY